jgi:uncharacterized protein (TIGR02453 family)
MAQEPYFGPELFDFLKDLKKNNKREWFNANKARYERDVRDPMLRFIGDFSKPLLKISPRIQAIPKKTGGSLFRIYRDTRFAKDKTPYKTHVAAQFRHEAGKDAHAPGFYLSLEKGKVAMGAGVWHPSGDALVQIRNAIAADAKGWKKVTASKKFKDHFALGGEALKRPPRGFDKDHPAIEEIKRKDFFGFVELDEETALRPDLLKVFTAHCKVASPMMSFLADAMHLPY